MITLKTEELNSICSKILFAVDSNGLSKITETIELVLKNNSLYLQVTNREYFIKIKLNTELTEDFHATVNAELFLKLISKITTEFVSLEVVENSLCITGNGKYKLPLIFDGDKLLQLPEITISNVTNTFNVSGDVLNSIFTYNSKQFAGKTITNPIQSFYYVDKDGAITFTTGACVNDFNLGGDVKLLLNAKLVKLFKLFKSEDVTFAIGHDSISQNLIQTKVSFKTSNIELTSLLSASDADIAKFPTTAIRGRVNKDYDYSISLNKNELLHAIDRLSVFSDKSTAINRTYGKFEFHSDKVVISDINGINTEELKYVDSIVITDVYNAVLDFVDIKAILDVSSEDYVGFDFGDNQAFVCTQGNIHSVIPEVE